ncbi:SDR family oxidoreductase [Staphylococcus delphini]|uniref:SDR family oxidoreductase n=1 Tax=Staphylococcus delphini TaxID=53344 RepID=UPI0021D03727|nr:SDR family oxidoreductase [Staphylococcus delphini]UXS28351.1 SDR family oxidoreductase [Staphylococcus delphini]UXS35949.1 SDR family oxidoreductase [Staphylococcus delphini]UXS43300.1 SDR family oxidoreductase [Staphylococcus delphini]UXV43994.1 SDR family oxidoreductase [Staphylococcus delphini]
MVEKNILIVGASGQISQEAIQLLLDETNHHLTLFLRNKSKLMDINNNQRITVIEGDATDESTLIEALSDIDIVFASLAGNIDEQARAIVSAMESKNVKKLIFVTALGIYDEVPGAFGKWNNENIGPYLPPYKKAADIIEQSILDYTILRPAWLTNYDEIDYETTGKEENFKGTEVSRKSVAALGLQIIQDNSLYSKESIGVNKPNTDGNKPQWL